MSITLTANADFSVEIDEQDLNDAIESYLDNNSYMTHSAVVDTVEEHIKDNVDISSEVESALEGYGFQTQNDVESLIEDRIGDFADRDDVRGMIDEALDGVDTGVSEEDVDDLIDNALQKADLKDLPRRFEVYAGKTDNLVNHNMPERLKALEESFDVEAHDNHVADLERRLDALQQTLHSQVARIEVLEAQVVKLDEATGEGSPAARFFKLAVQMLDIVRSGL